ncbi:MAG: potassium transporter [Limnobacter sp.]|nr:potassium transporter [Limnobacter sp.]
MLFQDLAVVPILFIVQAVAPIQQEGSSSAWWLAPVAVLGLIMFARYLVNPALQFMSRYGGREIMTGVALLIVLGSAELMHLAGLSAGMGAFMAGMMLANSSFRHQLEADLEPFKGLSLGLFFISIGMTLNLNLVLEQPFTLLLGTLGLMVLKTAIVAGLVRTVGIPLNRGLSLGLMLGQGGEFAFVIVAQALASGAVTSETGALVNLVVGLSMAATSPAVNYLEKRFALKEQQKETPSSYFDHTQPEVLILGFGRFGQVTGRILAANHIAFTALDKDAEHIEFVKKFGNLVYFGDAQRHELLNAAGVQHARVVVIAIDDPSAAIHIAKFVRAHYKNTTVVARAHNRTDYIRLKAAGAQVVIREMFPAGLQAAEATLNALGFSDSQAMNTVATFKTHDESILAEQFRAQGSQKEMLEISLRGREQLEEIFRKDQTDDHRPQ